MYFPSASVRLRFRSHVHVVGHAVVGVVLFHARAAHGPGRVQQRREMMVASEVRGHVPSPHTLLSVYACTHASVSVYAGREVVRDVVGTLLCCDAVHQYHGGVLCVRQSVEKEPLVSDELAEVRAIRHKLVWHLEKTSCLRRQRLHALVCVCCVCVLCVCVHVCVCVACVQTDARAYT